MRPTLLLGLGNPLMGDDGIGSRVAELLASDPRLPPDVEALCGGTDLLRWAEDMEKRERVVLVDAMLDTGPVGFVEIFEAGSKELEADLETRQWNAHHLSTPAAIALLRAASPAFRKVRVLLMAVTIQSAKTGTALSPALRDRLPEIVNAVLRGLQYG